MNDLLTDPKSFALALLGILMALLTWIGKNALKRLEHVERDAVRKAELEQFRKDQREEHEENKTLMGDIKEAITGTHRRIDDLYRDLMGKD